MIENVFPGQYQEKLSSVKYRQSSYKAERKDRKLNPSWQKDRRYQMFHPITKTKTTEIKN